MPEEIQNIFDDVAELKKINLWLGAFALTDNEVKEIIKLISRIILGSKKITDFYSEMKKIVRKDEATVKKITISAIQNRLWPLKDKIAGVADLLNQLGGTTNIEAETQKAESIIYHRPHISFSPEDDEEIKKIVSANNLPAGSYDYNSLAELIISESGYSVNGDEVIFGRLKNIVIARLKDVRDEMETAEALKKSRKIGGLEMTDDQAKKIITLVKAKIDQGLLSSLTKKDEMRSSILFPSKKPFNQGITTLAALKNQTEIKAPLVVLKKVVESKIEKPDLLLLPQIAEEDGLPVIKSAQGDDLMIKPKMLDPNHPNKISPVGRNDQIKTLPVMPLVSPPPVTMTPLAEKTVISPQPQPMTKATPLPKSIRFGKPLVDGVRLSNTLVGPVEELGTMTLINFRRLGETPSRSTAKIKDKIDLLEKDSYGQRLEGVAAWHKSEVNRFYRLLGQESMRQERSIDDIINERIKDNKPTLSIEEFNAVMELNRQLRY